jgi:nucleoside-diphosphate-sugar epimerase
MGKVVITGVAGFIGSHLAGRLLADGFDVTGVDSFDDYYDRRAKESNLAGLLPHRRFSFVPADLVTADLAALLGGCDRLFHLAAQPGVRGSWGAQFERYVRNNVVLTQRLLEGAVAQRVGRLIYASSSSVYGEQQMQPTAETALPSPISPYGATKLAAEHLVRLYGHEQGLDNVSLRFFTVYGPRQRPDMAFHKFIRAISRGEPITLFGQGQWRRDFTFVGDIVEGIVAASQRASNGDVLNLGRGSPVSLLEVVRLLEEVSGRTVDVRFGETGGGEVHATWADIRRAEQRIGFHPKTSLANGLRAQWEWQTQSGQGHA